MILVGSSGLTLLHGDPVFMFVESGDSSVESFHAFLYDVHSVRNLLRKFFSHISPPDWYQDILNSFPPPPHVSSRTRFVLNLPLNGTPSIMVRKDE